MTPFLLPLRRWLRTLQAKLLILPVILVLVFIWGGTLVAGSYLFERQKDFLVAQQRSAATVFAEVIAQKVGERTAVMATLASHIDTRRLQDGRYPQGFLEQRFSLGQQFPAGAILLDADGRVVADLPQREGHKGMSYADREYFKQARDTRQVVVSSPITGRMLHKTVVAFAAPLLDAQGQFAGALVGAIDISSSAFLGLLNSARAMGNNEFYLVDLGEKRTIASSDPTRVMEPLLNNEFSRRLAQGDTLFFAQNRLGIEKIYAIAPIEHTDWKLVIALPTEVAFAASTEMRRALLWVALLSTLVGLGLTALMSRRLVQPLQRVAREMDAMTTERVPLAPIPEHGDTEVRSLMASFNRLVNKLQSQSDAQESTIQQRTQELQDLYDRAPCGYHSLNAEGVIIQVNQTELQYLGYSRAELVGRPVYDFLSPASAQRVRAQYPLFLQSGDLRDMEVEFVCKDGSLRPFRVSANLVRADDGHVLYSRSTLTDDRERKLQSQKMQELYQFLQDVVEKLPFGLLVFDGQHRIVLHNSLLESMLRLPPSFLRSGPVYHSTLLAFKHQRGDFGAAPLEEIVQAYTQSLDGRQPVKFERVYSDGRCFEVLGQPLLADHMVVTYTDTTRQKEIEREILASKALAEAATRAKSQFLANMSHEIRTPMNGILGLAYVLEKMPLAEEAHRLVHRIKLTGRTLQTILNDILDFSKIEAQQMQLEHSRFTLDEVFDSVSSIMLGDPTRPGVELAIVPPQQAVAPLLGDGLRLGQVLINLVGNAIKFTHHGYVRLLVSPVQSDAQTVTLRFAVQDSGIGMGAQEIAEVFKPFNQADASTTRRYGGTGLGLSISRRLVELMGGTLQVSSQPGVGSEFHFTLTLPRAEPTPLQQTLQQLELLIADDSEVAREALRHTALALGWRPTLVDGGEAAVQKVLQRQAAGLEPEVLLIDWKMPDLDGLGVARQVHAALAQGHGPIVILATAHSRDELLAQPDVHLVDAVLNKPVTASALHDAVATALRRRGQVAKATTTTPQRRLAGLRLLVVDDSEINREVASLIFGGEGARVEVAPDGLEALQWMERNLRQVDLVLMDVQMPGLNGLQVARILKADGRYTTLPIVALSAAAFSKDREAALAAGMVDFIAKPMDVERAIAVVLAHAPRTAHSAAHPTEKPAAVPPPPRQHRRSPAWTWPRPCTCGVTRRATSTFSSASWTSTARSWTSSTACSPRNVTP